MPTLPRRDIDGEINALIAKVNAQNNTLTESVKPTISNLADKQSAYINKTFRESIAEGAKLQSIKRDFLMEAKETLLGECLHMIYARSLIRSFGENTVSMDSTKRVITSYIKENGVDNLLRGMKYKSVLLSELAMLVEKYHHIVEKACEDCSDSKEVKMPSEAENDFYKELDMEDVEDVIFQISDRVNDAIDDFVTSNTLNKMQIKEILKGSQEKLANTKSETQKESVERIAGNNIHSIKNHSMLGVFAAMVEATANAVMKTDALRESFMDGTNLDMERIVESCKLSYTLMEMVNTLKMERLDEGTVLSIIKNIK